jgi:hypothetical protein
VATKLKAIEKKEKVNKGQTIRDFLKANKDQKFTSREIADRLTAQAGVTISPSYVENVKYTMRQKKSKKASNKPIDVNDLILTKDLIAKLGGIERTKQALDYLTKLVG